MNYLNHVTLIGRICRKGEIKRLSADVSVIEFGLALNQTYRNDKNEKKEKTVFVDCQAWRGRAQVVEAHLTIGQVVCLVGKIDRETWEKDGQKRSRTFVTIDDIVLLNTAPRKTEQPASVMPTGPALGTDPTASIPF